MTLHQFFITFLLSQINRNIQLFSSPIVRRVLLAVILMAGVTPVDIEVVKLQTLTYANQELSSENSSRKINTKILVFFKIPAIYYLAYLELRVHFLNSTLYPAFDKI